MVLKSYSRWYDSSRARDEMFLTTHTQWAPWHIVRSDDKKRARLNLIKHLPGSVPYKELRREKIVLPKQQEAGGYEEVEHQVDVVPELY
jgi:hypothetical protein